MPNGPLNGCKTWLIISNRSIDSEINESKVTAQHRKTNVKCDATLVKHTSGSNSSDYINFNQFWIPKKKDGCEKRTILMESDKIALKLSHCVCVCVCVCATENQHVELFSNWFQVDSIVMWHRFVALFRLGLWHGHRSDNRLWHFQYEFSLESKSNANITINLMNMHTKKTTNVESKYLPDLKLYEQITHRIVHCYLLCLCLECGMLLLPFFLSRCVSLSLDGLSICFSSFVHLICSFMKNKKTSPMRLAYEYPLFVNLKCLQFV